MSNEKLLANWVTHGTNPRLVWTPAPSVRVNSESKLGFIPGSFNVGEGNDTSGAGRHAEYLHNLEYRDECEFPFLLRVQILKSKLQKWYIRLLKMQTVKLFYEDWNCFQEGLLK